jgi:L-proline amide hydrolase
MKPPFPFTEGHAPFRDEFATWYRITGTLNAPHPPLIVLHGGPGCTHDYVDSLKNLAATGRAVIHYDQLGNGHSTHLPAASPEFWTPALFVEEFFNLVAHLKLKTYDIYGQSWGGMLGAEIAVRQPAGLRRLVIANSPADMPTWVAEANRLRAALPADVNATLLKHEAAGSTDSPEYLQAMDVFYARHVCRIQPMPPAVQRTFDAMAGDPTVYHTMNGPSEFHCIGSMKDWDIRDQLHKITVPVLLISGKYDEATIAVVTPYLQNIKHVEWHIFGASSHMPHVEEEQKCLAITAQFLNQELS